MHEDLVKRFEKNFPLVDNEIELKIGAIVILTKNDKDDERLVNGLKGKIVGFKYKNYYFNEENNDEIHVDINSKLINPIVKFYNIEETIMISSKIWQLKSKEDKFLMSRRQIPLKLAFGLTIHKSQGMSIPSLYIDFKRVFKGEQLYVSLSRTMDTKNLKIVGFDFRKIKADQKVINFMFKNFRKELSNDSNLKLNDKLDFNSILPGNANLRKRKDENNNESNNKIIKLE
jgi:ATP-dependent DNA helicase PIF1